MADIALTIPRRSALEGHYMTGDFGTICDGAAPGITLQERRALAIVHLDAWADQGPACAKAIAKGCGTAPAKEAAKAAEQDGTAVLWVGPNRWLVTETERRDLFAALSATVTPDLAALTDQGHSRTCWRVSGPKIRDLLAKGSTIDFDRGIFGAGDCVGTLLGHFTVVIHCREESREADSVDIYGARSFAVDLHHWLTSSSLEYGLRVLDPA